MADGTQNTGIPTTFTMDTKNTYFCRFDRNKSFVKQCNDSYTADLHLGVVSGDRTILARFL